MHCALESGLWTRALKTLWKSPDPEERTVISAGLHCKANGHNSQSLFQAMFLLTSLCLSFPNPELGLRPPPNTAWTILNEYVRAALWLCCYYCDSMFFQNWISKQRRPKFPWIADGEMKKWKQRVLPRTTLTFNSRNREIKAFSWM